MKNIVDFEQANDLLAAGIIIDAENRHYKDDGTIYAGFDLPDDAFIPAPLSGELEEWIMQHTGAKWQNLDWHLWAEAYGLDIDGYEHKIDFLVDLCIKMKEEKEGIKDGEL